MNGIIKCRQAAGLTQNQLAKKLHVSRSSIAMWETGKSHPRASMLVELSKVLGVTVDQLLEVGGNGEEPGGSCERAV